MRLFWTPEAEQDRDGFYTYIEADSPLAALELDEVFSDRARILADFPEIGRLGREPGTRELVIHEHYVLIYEIEGNSVRILRVLHASRQWPPLER